MLEFTYKNGRGRVQLNLENIIPCSASDMRKIVAFLNLSDDPEKNAATVYDYIAAHVDELKKERAIYNQEIEKEEISRVNALIKKYLSNAAPLVKLYGLPDMTDDAAKIILHAATVYAVVNSKNGRAVEPFDGWTFEKAGFTFDVRRHKYGRNKSEYIIMMYGLELARTAKKNQVAAEITPRIIDILTRGAEMRAKAKENFEALITAAGYRRPERPEIISKQKEEEKEVSDYTFAAASFTCKGKTFPCEYRIIQDGAVLVFAIIETKEDGRREKQRICFNPDHPDHAAALAAAKEAEKTGARPENISTGYTKITTPAGNLIKPAATVPAEKPAPASAFEGIPVIDTTTGETITDNAAEMIEAAKQETETPARDPKQARGPVPEKTFIGETIQGNGWRIVFDGAAGRTRIVFDQAPTAAAKEATEKAGFYYSSVMNSWNKKLTFKAYRAAKALSEELSRVYAA